MRSRAAHLLYRSWRVAWRTAAGVAVVLIATSLAVAASGVVNAPTNQRRTVHLRGTAYEFNNVDKLLTGATIRVAQFPKLKAVVGRDGRYDLVVPNHAKVTPYIVAAGHHTIYLQTFTTNGEDLTNVNFQTPSDAVYNGLVALLNVPVDSNGNPILCAIVSTFSTRNVRGLDFRAFIAYGAHGVAGATATATPALPKPVYFNQDVLPDRSQAASSKDGGVVWTGVPAGVYTITGHHPLTRFASFVATCRPGRVINANPPWGLYQFGLPDPARVSAAWSVDRARTLVRSLSVRRLPAGAVVTARCTGARCPFAGRAFRPHRATLDLRGALGASRLRLRAGDALNVTVSADRFNGSVWRWVIVSGHAPARTTLCVPLGNTKPRHRCPAS
jgi:hypothetical protein